MNRREALAATTALVGSSIVGAQVFLSGCTSRKKTVDGFDREVLSLLDQIAETILPVTSTSPGAGSCNIGEFMKVMVSECYSPDDRKIFFDGLTSIQQKSQKQYGSTFEKITGQQKHDLLLTLDDEARNIARETNGQSVHFFNMLHQLTLLGYFSSEPGATQALRYVPIPGRYEGCIPYHEGEAAWLY